MCCSGWVYSRPRFLLLANIQLANNNYLSLLALVRMAFRPKTLVIHSFLAASCSSHPLALCNCNCSSRGQPSAAYILRICKGKFRAITPNSSHPVSIVCPYSAPRRTTQNAQPERSLRPSKI